MPKESYRVALPHNLKKGGKKGGKHASELGTDGTQIEITLSNRNIIPARPAASKVPLALAFQVARSPCMLFLVDFGGASQMSTLARRQKVDQRLYVYKVGIRNASIR